MAQLILSKRIDHEGFLADDIANGRTESAKFALTAVDLPKKTAFRSVNILMRIQGYSLIDDDYEAVP